MAQSTESQFDMGYTDIEFAKVLQGNFTGVNSPFNCKRQQNNSWLISHDKSAMQIEIFTQSKAARVLGAMSLPVLTVTFNVSSSTTEQTAFFFDKFFKYFHKGGG